ncbi:type IV pilin protein [Aureivirga marina]|uniref:type IV pilin protein n=1 Tax=Aureivirga marina TaxID=1182451 RepID=UPI0018C9F8DD|nr:prepilin-type N-terminal cleavage/methylation domain-containing protein [Aureivirga marina]
MKKNKTFKKLKAYSLTEILIVLAIIGILIMLVLPKQTGVVAQAKAIEAQNMLSQLYALETNYFYRFSKYSNNLEEVGFVHEKTISEGGQAVYQITIVEASTNSFRATATALSDFDNDGVFNQWEIDHNRIMKETVKD